MHCHAENTSTHYLEMIKTEVLLPMKKIVTNLNNIHAHAQWYRDTEQMIIDTGHDNVIDNSNSYELFLNGLRMEIISIFGKLPLPYFEKVFNEFFKLNDWKNMTPEQMTFISLSVRHNLVRTFGIQHLSYFSELVQRIVSELKRNLANQPKTDNNKQFIENSKEPMEEQNIDGNAIDFKYKKKVVSKLSTIDNLCSDLEDELSARFGAKSLPIFKIAFNVLNDLYGGWNRANQKHFKKAFKNLRQKLDLMGDEHKPFFIDLRRKIRKLLKSSVV